MSVVSEDDYPKALPAADAQAPRAGGIGIPLLLLALPIFLSLALQMAGAFMETALASRSGTAVLGAISVGATIEALPVAFIAGLLYAIVPAVGRLKGAGRSDEILPLLYQGLVVALFLALLFGLGVLIFSEAIFRRIGVDPAMLGGLQTYLYFVPVFIVGGRCFFLGRNFVEAYSFPVVVTLAVVAGLLAKVAGIGLFVFGWLGAPRLDVIGFGIAGACFYVVANAVLLGVCLWHPQIRHVLARPPSWSDVAPRRLFALVRSGFPIGCNYLSDLVVIAFMGLSIASLDMVSAGAHALAFNIQGMALAATGAIAMAASILVAQRRGDMLRITCTALLAGVVIVALPSGVLLFAPDLVLALYRPDADIEPLARTLFAILPWLLLLPTAATILGFVLRGLDDGAAVFLVYFLAAWGIWAPLGYLWCFTDWLGAARGVSGWWYAYAVASAAMVVTLALRLGYVSRRQGAARRIP